MHSSTQKTSQSKQEKSNPPSTSSTVKETTDAKSMAHSSPSATPCALQTSTATSSFVAPLNETLTDTTENPGTKKSLEQNPQPAQDMNPTESSSGIHISPDFPSSSPFKPQFNSWWEDSSNGSRPRHMIFLRLQAKAGWVVCDFESIIPKEQLFYAEEYGHDMHWYNPVGFPPFGSFDAYIIPCSKVKGINKGTPHPDWNYYHKLREELLTIDLPSPKKRHL